MSHEVSVSSKPRVGVSSASVFGHQLTRLVRLALLPGEEEEGCESGGYL